MACCIQGQVVGETGACCIQGQVVGETGACCIQGQVAIESCYENVVHIWRYH